MPKCAEGEPSVRKPALSTTLCVYDSLDAQTVVGVVQEVKPSSKKQASYRMKWTAVDGESVETTVNVLTKVDEVINEGGGGGGGRRRGVRGERG